MTSFTIDSASCLRSSWRLIEPSSRRGMPAAAIVPSAMLLIVVIVFLSNPICRDFRFWAVAVPPAQRGVVYTNISDTIG